MEIEGTLGKAMLKGCLWMNGDTESSEEGEQSEASQQSKLHLRGVSINNAYSKKTHPTSFHF
ncbi:MAG: hypothetical protein QHH18_01335 [Candidatus Bathyarchaeota archaeon]|nr:hypothetical protein [Candidatus Bathyarchaeota archaeon A05DMB-5]MDH7557235.1 hypothetical protein [Candidatus Bathyarchaeota archaeon]